MSKNDSKNKALHAKMGKKLSVKHEHSAKDEHALSSSRTTKRGTTRFGGR